MDEAAALFAKLPAAELPDEQVLRTLDNKALGQFVLGQKEPAVKTWQELLERFPKSKQYATVEDHLQEALELNSKGRFDGEEDRALAAAVAACDPRRCGRRWCRWPRASTAKRGCGGCGRCSPRSSAPAVPSRSSTRPWGCSSISGADYAERHGDCAMFERMATAYGRVRPEGLDKMRADHPGCLRQEGK